MAGSSRARACLAALCALTGAIALWNAHAYPPGQGYDAADHIAYADDLIAHGSLPHGTGEYYTPPGFYAVAGSVDWLGAKAGLGERHRATQALDALLLVATVILVYLLALRLQPGRVRFALAAAAFVGLSPVTLKAAAMFHPETLDLFLSTLALLLCVRLLQGGRSLQLALLLGAVLGAAQLVRAFSLWTVAACVLAVAAARRWRELAVVIVVAALIPAPWYVHQRQTYGGSPVFNRPTKSKPIWSRRPASFYVDPGIPDVFTAPYRPHYLNRALPTTYTELWGDYFGVWAWRGDHAGPGATRSLRIQSLVGLLPTALAVAGAVLLLLRARRPARLAPALLPVLGILGYLYFTVSYPTPDGDVLKGTYMLTTAAAWALGFGYALDRLAVRWRRPALVLLGIGAIVQLPFLVY